MLFFSRDLGIDLGTSNVLIYAAGRGIVLREPSVVAVDRRTGKILEVGQAARQMLGRTPGELVAVRPLEQGYIADCTMAEEMVSAFLRKALPRLPERERLVITLRYGLKDGVMHPQHEIAAMLGISRSYVSRLQYCKRSILKKSLPAHGSGT